MKAEDYVCEWLDNRYRGAKDLGDWHEKDVMRFANDFANKKILLLIKGEMCLCGKKHNKGIRWKCDGISYCTECIQDV